MQFIDKSKINVRAGDGGNGKSSFRREKIFYGSNYRRERLKIFQA